MKRRSWLWSLGLVALLVGILSSVALAVDLTFTTWSYGVETVQENIGIFEKLNPGVNVKHVDASWFDYHDVMVTRFFSKTPVDVLYGSDHWLQEWAAAGWIVPLEDYYPWAKGYIKEFAPYATQGMTYKNKLYGLPYYADIMIFIYNEEMVKKAGFSGPPKTWDELIEQCKVMKQKDICDYPLVFEFSQQEGAANEVLISMIYSRKNGHLFDGLDPVFDKPNSAALTTVKWVTDAMRTSKVCDPASLTLGEIDLVKSLQAGKHAFTILPKYNLAELNNPASSKLAGKFKMALMPGETHETVGYVRFYALAKQTADRGKAAIDAAGKFIEYFGGKTKGQYVVEKKWAVEKGLGFAQLPLYDDPEVVAAINKWGDVKLELEQSNLARAKEGMSPYYGTWDLFARAELHKAYLGQQTPEAVLKSLAAKWNSLRK